MKIDTYYQTHYDKRQSNLSNNNINCMNIKNRGKMMMTV